MTGFVVWLNMVAVLATIGGFCDMAMNGARYASPWPFIIALAALAGTKVLL